jgi:YceI-like protein
MTRRPLTRTAFSCALGLVLSLAGAGATGAGPAPYTGALALGGTISIAGTSNIHAYTASTRAVRVTRVQLASRVAGPGFWADVVTPGGLEAFDIAVAAATLSSPKEGVDKNMHKALKVTEHEDITFHLRRLEARPGPAGSLRGIGLLQIAGVEREVALTLTTERRGETLAVHGEVDILMTDFGITPPKALMGMLKTDPTVTITFDTLLTVPQT